MSERTGVNLQFQYAVCCADERYIAVAVEYFKLVSPLTSRPFLFWTAKHAPQTQSVMTDRGSNNVGGIYNVLCLPFHQHQVLQATIAWMYSGQSHKQRRYSFMLLLGY